MNSNELKELLRNKGITIVPKEQMRIRGFDVDTFRKLAKQTESVDYDCDFSGGICRSLARGGNGCCQRCAGGFGYWRKEGYIDDDTAKRLADSFDEKTGFLRDGEGCIIPRELRSPTCLYIYCSDEKMSGEDRLLLYRIEYGAHWG